MSEESYIKLARLILVSFDKTYGEYVPESEQGIIDHHTEADILELTSTICEKEARLFGDKLNARLLIEEPHIYTMTFDDRARLQQMMVKVDDIGTMEGGVLNRATRVLEEASNYKIYHGYWPRFKGAQSDNRLEFFRGELIRVYNIKRMKCVKHDTADKFNPTYTAEKLDIIFSNLKKKFKEKYQIPLDDSEFPKRTFLPGAQRPPLTSRLFQQIHTLSDAVDKLQLKTY